MRGDFSYVRNRMKEPQDFIAWACDPARTNDELFTVELLIELMRYRSNWRFKERHDSFDIGLAKKKERHLNPAYRPSLLVDEIEELGQHAATVTHFRSGGSYDRPLRDLHALSFFPALEEIGISHSDVCDFSPLAKLPHLKRLTVMETGTVGGYQAAELEQWGEMRELEYFHLFLRHSWPDLRALAKWPALQEFHFHGNILALCDVEILPAAELVEISTGGCISVPLRDLTLFPAMPKAKRLILKSTASLNGVERYAHVLNLLLGGEFRDLTPVASLSNVTYLELTGEHFTELAPLCRMPKLRELEFVRERSLDLAVLTEAPQLRRVTFSRCPMMRMELAALNAGLLPEAADFEAEESRALVPLKFFVVSKKNEAAKEFFEQRTEEIVKPREAFYQGDKAWEAAETRSFHAALQAKLDTLLGRGWGLAKARSWSAAGQALLTFKRFRDTSRIREILELLRGESARSRFPWSFCLNVEPHGDMSYELEELKKLDEETKEAEAHWLAAFHEPEHVLRENEESLQRHEETFEYLRREHFLRLQQEQGCAVDPELLLPAKEPPIPPPELKDENEELRQSRDDEGENEGGVAIAPPPPPPPEASSLGEALSYYVDLYEDCVVAQAAWIEPARYGLGEAPVEWPG